MSVYLLHIAVGDLGTVMPLLKEGEGWKKLKKHEVLKVVMFAQSRLNVLTKCVRFVEVSSYRVFFSRILPLLGR